MVRFTKVGLGATFIVDGVKARNLEEKLMKFRMRRRVDCDFKERLEDICNS